MQRGLCTSLHLSAGLCTSDHCTPAPVHLSGTCETHLKVSAAVCTCLCTSEGTSALAHAERLHSSMSQSLWSCLRVAPLIFSSLQIPSQLSGPLGHLQAYTLTRIFKYSYPGNLPRNVSRGIRGWRPGEFWKLPGNRFSEHYPGYRVLYPGIDPGFLIPYPGISI